MRIEYDGDTNVLPRGRHSSHHHGHRCLRHIPCLISGNQLQQINPARCRCPALRFAFPYETIQPRLCRACLKAADEFARRTEKTRFNVSRFAEGEYDTFVAPLLTPLTR